MALGPSPHGMPPNLLGGVTYSNRQTLTKMTEVVGGSRTMPAPCETPMFGPFFFLIYLRCADAHVKIPPQGTDNVATRHRKCRHNAPKIPPQGATRHHKALKYECPKKNKHIKLQPPHHHAPYLQKHQSSSPQTICAFGEALSTPSLLKKRLLWIASL